ncbi:MAG: hypothetical protein QW227_00320 [Candidatus Aenigmatarchaeota archaeon]
MDSEKLGKEELKVHAELSALRYMNKLLDSMCVYVERDKTFGQSKG